MSELSNWVVRAIELSKRVTTPAGSLTILEQVSLEAAAGESLAIVGASGSGKTTLLGLLAGLDRPSEGSVELLGTRLDPLGEDERAALRLARVGFVFQSFHLLQSLTALENIMLPLELAGADAVLKRAQEALTEVGLAARGDHYPNQLSGGEQQRVALARAFVHRPAVLFADEPTGNLDGHTGDQVIDLLFDLNRDTGTTLVLVTHEARLAQRCGRQIRLDAGRVVGS